ncbi:MAG: formylmethanofuran dehydrogenase [Nitrospirae bacterium]|nr:MAG: formylmethanofuran dehydrogenase [Nitrospirota bacterium]
MMQAFDDAVEFHGHSCPGLAIGYRVSLRALKELGGRSADEEIVAIVENSSCAVDAVQVMTGCTFGKGNLIFRDYGKQVYTFISRQSEKSIRIAVHLTKQPETAEEHMAWAKYMKGDRSKSVLKQVHDRKAAKLNYILKAGDKELLEVRKGRTPLPAEAHIYRSLTCETCSEQMMEPRARIREGKTVCIPCFEARSL